MSGHVELAWQHARHVAAVGLVPVALDVRELRQRGLRLRIVGRDAAEAQVESLVFPLRSFMSVAQNSSTLPRSESVLAVAIR